MHVPFRICRHPLWKLVDLNQGFRTSIGAYMFFIRPFGCTILYSNIVCKTMILKKGRGYYENLEVFSSLFVSVCNPSFFAFIISTVFGSSSSRFRMQSLFLAQGVYFFYENDISLG